MAVIAHPDRKWLVVMTALHFDSTDLDTTEEFLSQAYAKMSIGGHARSTRTRVTREAAGSINMDELAMTYDLAHDAEEPMGKVCICTVQSGGITRQYFPHGDQGSFAAGDVFMYAPHDSPYAGVIRGAQYNLVMFDPGLFDDIAAPAPSRQPASVHLTGDRPVSAAAVRHFHAVARYVRDDVLAEPTISNSPLVVSSASRLLAASVLQAFPNNALMEPTARDNRDGHPGSLRRAIAFIENHPGLDVTLSDIARAAHVGPRALQVAFRRHLDMTPMAYLRRVRLAHAHAELLAADPGTATVTGIAARWGYARPSSFAADYLTAYGRHPHQALRD